MIIAVSMIDNVIGMRHGPHVLHDSPQLSWINISPEQKSTQHICMALYISSISCFYYYYNFYIFCIFYIVYFIFTVLLVCTGTLCVLWHMNPCGLNQINK